MTEKRGTGENYGKEILNDRAEKYDSSVESKKTKPKSKLKLLAVMLISLIGVGALYPVVFGGKTTPKDKMEEIVAVNASGNPLENGDPEKAAADKAADDKAEADRLAAELAEKEKKAAHKVAVEKAEADKKAAAEKVLADKAEAERAASKQRAADIAASEKAEQERADALLEKSAPDENSVAKSASDVGTLTGAAESNLPPSVVAGTLKAASDINSNGSQAEETLIDLAAPANPSAELPPSAAIVSAANSKLPDSDSRSIAKAVINDPTVKSTYETVKVSGEGHETHQYNPSDYGLNNNDAPNPISGPVQKPDYYQPHNRMQYNPQPSMQAAQVPSHVEPSKEQTGNDATRNYVGQSSEVGYEIQNQNTVYVYGTFAAKVYLLPLAKGEKINAYLTDKDGWVVNHLPGDILRIERSSNRAKWSAATDLFLVAGKRTYTLILQAVDDPSQRTDSLRYKEQKSEPVKTAKR